MVNVEQVASPRQMQEFIAFPLELYRAHPLYAPHLLYERRRFFSSANPLFAFTEAAYFLARDAAGKVTGRVSAHVNRRHIEATGEQTGFFGFFESVPDRAVAAALLARVEDWLRARGMASCRGPCSFSTNDECGFLASGFDRTAGMMMPYSPEYYLEFARELGYVSTKVLLAYEKTGKVDVPADLALLAGRVRRNTGATVRPFDPTHLAREMMITREIYNAAWQGNWGFVPMSRDEFHFASKDLRLALDPSIALVAEIAGRPVGVLFALPDFSPLLRRLRGRLLPFGWIHFLCGRRKLTGLRVVLLGVLPECRRRGIDLLLCHDFFHNAVANGYRSAELSWILEDNLPMRHPLERMGCTVSKTYRIVEKTL